MAFARSFGSAGFVGFVGFIEFVLCVGYCMFLWVFGSCGFSVSVLCNLCLVRFVIWVCCVILSVVLVWLGSLTLEVLFLGWVCLF